MIEEILTREYGDATRLIESIREEAARRISALDEEAAKEVQRFQSECDAEIQAFAAEQERQTDKEIAKAIAIMKNRVAIDKRKMRLNAVEDFMRTMVMKAVSGFVTENPDGYISFLENAISETLHGADGRDLLIRLCPKDAGLETRLHDYITGEAGYRGSVSFIVDDKLSGRGIVIQDEKEGVSYNRTVDRIVDRAYDEIRKEVSSIVQEFIKDPD
ncbi:MAG TPA: V-type ATP synthase subunit E [Spirochaetota bacterium]|nr:V-type ATP synthase subunit E [Spirochaetota bacterium]HPI90963.1 V-type ATP synthase subunit E [Spirochaetota bacterium]HPR47322.1 V-type ATP synthase subunit E [Spirochaetota bacterium]